MAKLDFHTQLKNLNMPTLILSGRFDRGMLPLYAVQFKPNAPKAQSVMFEKSGHFPFIEERRSSSSESSRTSCGSNFTTMTIRLAEQVECAH
jgi:hypothetical protein